MERDAHARSTAPADAYIEGSEIGSGEQPDAHDGAGDAVDQSRSDVVGDNATITGDADAMTSGNTTGPLPDDDAQRAQGKQTDVPTTYGGAHFDEVQTKE